MFIPKAIYKVYCSIKNDILTVDFCMFEKDKDKSANVV